MSLKYNFDNTLNLKINKLYCDYYIKKDGKIIFLPYLYDKYLCIINKFNLINIVTFPYLYDKDEDSIAKKLFILYILQQQNLKYIKINEPLDKNKNYKIYLFDESKINTVLELTFLVYIYEKDKKIYNYYFGTKLKALSTVFMINKLMYNKTDKKILILIFYTFYIDIIRHDIYNKYKKNLNDFKNYNDLYIFLKKEGYVDKYYNYYSSRMINNYNNYYKKIINHDELQDFKDNYKKKIKNLKDINLIKLIDNYVNNKFNKEYIKNKFIDLVEKYNI
jgi:hypothetical protein